MLLDENRFKCLCQRGLWDVLSFRSLYASVCRLLEEEGAEKFFIINRHVISFENRLKNCQLVSINLPFFSLLTTRPL